MAFHVATLYGQDTNSNHRVFLLGNTADIDLDSNFYTDFSKFLPTDEPFSVIINGDLIKGNNGGKLDAQDSLKIDNLLRPLSKFKNAKVFILPGDRDWSNSGKKGLDLVKKLGKLIKSMDFDNVEWLIKKGCAGPELIDINENLSLLAFNTQWYNHPYDKPDAASADCKFGTTRDILIELENVIEDAEDRNVLVAGHFPLMSLGEYGGHFPIGRHLEPPVIGSFKVGYRQNIGTPKDIGNSRFSFIRGSIENIMSRKGSVIYAGGHEKNLQVLKMSKDTYVVNSGSPTKARYVSKDKDKALYSKALAGVMEIDYLPTGEVDYKIHGYNKKNGFKTDGKGVLFTSACEASVDGIPENGVYIPCKPEAPEGKHAMTWAKDTVAIGGDYTVDNFTRFMLGEHYRTTWNTPVDVPYLDLENTFGGLTVYEKGGGHQTTSLKIKGGDGKEYVFRSVDKDPTQLLPFALQNTVISRTLQDITSQQQPYGAMAIGSMLDATEILHARPKLYMMPPSDDLGAFKNKYENLLGMLEEKPKNVKEVKVPFAGADEIHQSKKMFRELYKDHDNKVDAKEYAKSRMFDILVGDWGKHEDNFKWAGYETEDGLLYRPIPRDRDYVFSRWDGFLTYLADRKWGLQIGENFGYELNDIRSLTFSSQPADRRLLAELTREDWQEAAEYIQTRITDVVIEDAIKTMPPETYEASGKVIAAKLKQRSKDLKKYADEYYDLLKYGGVEVVGSNKREYFEVVRNADGTVRVSMYNGKKGDEKKGKKLLYDRTFNPKEIEEIRLYGLDGEDVFAISGEAKKSIKIKVIGGSDPDDVFDTSKVKSGGKKTLVYERGKSAKIELGEEGKQVDTWNKALYDYDRHRLGYNRYLPIAAVSFNSRVGFGVLAGVQFTQYQQDKNDFSSKHGISGFFSTESVNILKYNGRFHHVLHKWDVTIGARYADSDSFNNFFGIGNGTFNDDDLDSDDFYQVRLNNFGFNAGLIKDFWKKSYLSFDFNYENNETLREEGTILAVENEELVPGVFGLEDVDLVTASATLDIDFRDRSSLPERGIRLFANYTNGFITNADNNPDDSYGIISGFIEQYYSTRGKSPLTLGLKVGGATSYNDESIPFYKLPLLGQNNNLRGFDNNRFSGRSVMYVNTEVRMPVASFRTSFLPLKLGVKAFYDGGRVFSDFDTSAAWHNGYGAGIYLVPVSESFAINLSAGFSDEESVLILFGIGTTFR